MSIFFDLFSPGQRHRVDEQERLEHTREVEGQAEPGRGPIDLNSGVVRIKPATPAAVKAEGAMETTADDEAAGFARDEAGPRPGESTEKH